MNNIDIRTYIVENFKEDNEEKIRNSAINSGLVTVKFPSMSKVEIEKKDIYNIFHL